ncbi:hypothetical protein QQ045_032742 [Rhodiola kirilowii]
MVGVRQMDRFSKYLGLSVAFSYNKTEIFKFIVDRIWQKVQGCKEQTSSMAGKEILIKSILQAIPTYAMMCFKLPVSLCKKIVGIISKYWWNNKGGGRCIHWGSYKLLCKTKEVGGLGLRDFESFSEALLAKQIWRLQSNQEAMASRLIKAKYFKDTDVLQSQLGHRPSFMWRSLWNVKNKISQWITLEGMPQKPFWTGQDNDQEFSIILHGARQIWFNRNLVVNGKSGLNPYADVVTMLEMVQWSLKLEYRFVVTTMYDDGSWKPPEDDYVKINVDGAWDRETRKAGFRLCCRDSAGAILFVEACPILHLSSSFEVELWSLQRSF